MSHEITVRTDGFEEAAFAVEPAWHGLGSVLPDAMTSTEAMVAAGLGWQVIQHPLAYLDPGAEGVPSQWKPIVHENGANAMFANVRSDNGNFLGAVSNAYHVCQNDEAFAFLDSLASNGEVKFEAAFSLRGGKQVCLLARMPGEFENPGQDRVLPYVLCSLTHDGTGAVRFGPTAVRVVCANTYAFAEKKGTLRNLSIRHSSNMQDKLENARKMLLNIRSTFNTHAEVSALMAQHRFTRDQWGAFLDVMCPVLPKEDPDWTECRAAGIERTRNALSLCYQDETNDGSPMTAWAAFNSVTQHIDHLPRRGATRARKAEARWNVTQYGAGRDQKHRAFVAAARMAGVDDKLIAAAC